MSIQLQKKKLSAKNSDSSTFDVELQPLVSPSNAVDPFSPSSPLHQQPSPASFNPFNNFPASPMSSQAIYYPLSQNPSGVTGVPVTKTGLLTVQANPFIPKPQILQPQGVFQPQVLSPQQQPLPVQQQYFLPQMLPQYIPQVLPAYNNAASSYPSQLATQTPVFSSSVLSPVAQPSVGQFLYPVIEQPVKGGNNYPNIEPNQEPTGSKEPGTREKTKSEKVKESKKERTPQDLTLDQVITKRCKRCSAYYVESELAQAENKTPCKYHPGTIKTGYSSTLISGARLQYWTCCKSSNKNDPGCKTGKHIEDPQMTTIQCRQQPPQAQVGILIDFAPPSKEQSNEKEKESQKPEKTKNLIRHYVTDADTLIGIAFRYHVTPQAIRKLNRMPNDDVQGYSKLYVPRKGTQVNLSELESDSEEEEEGPPQNLSEAERALFEKRMLMKLRAQTGITNEEASYYLTMFGWSYNTALKEYQEDIEWEKNHKRLPTRKCK